ncbi:hypothetical protein L7F22_033292 [Adiantum nelumboides]|nr:hypothetical protein [Adiantum nelumboides]
MLVTDVPDTGEPDEQPEVEEKEILVPEQILAHKDTKNKGKVRRQFLVKFKNYPALDAKWMEEEDLADTPQIVNLYLEAWFSIVLSKRNPEFSLAGDLVQWDAQEGSHSTPLSTDASI